MAKHKAKKAAGKTKAAKARVAVKTSARKAAAAKRAATSSSRRKARVTRAAKPQAKRAASAPKTAAKARKPQTVAVSHYNNADFESGLRSYAEYRDLGIVDASHGMVRAHVLRFTEPCDPEVVSKLHYHDTQFQMVYVLKGWMKTRLGDMDEITMRAGSAWTQPPKIRHVVTDYSDDCEVLEIILPAEFETVEV